MSDKRDPQTDQQLPVQNENSEYVQDVMVLELTQWNMDTDVREAIEKGIAQRRQLGIRKYGTPLMTHNGRDALVDAWQEALDLFTYLYQLELEDEGSQGDATLPYAQTALESLTRQRIERGDTDFG